MRPNNSNKRTRGRSRSKNSNPLARSYESNGPDVKIRGSALQVADKYAQLARDAQSAGDRVMAENYFQHAEHYYRIVAQAYEQNNQNQQMRDRRDDDRGGMRPDDRQPYRGGEQPTINGYDGLEDEDEGMRRALRVNGHQGGNGGPRPHAGPDDDEDDHPAASADNQGGVSQPTIDAGDDDDAEEAPKPRRVRAKAENASETQEDAGDDSDGEEAPKPRRRSRSTTTRRARSRSTTAPAEVAAPEATSETTN